MPNVRGNSVDPVAVVFAVHQLLGLVAEARLRLARRRDALKGVTPAPVTSRLVGELVAGVQPSHDLWPFRPERLRPFLQRPPS